MLISDHKTNGLGFVWVLSTPPSSTPSDQRVALRCLACNTAQAGRSNMAKVRPACVNIRHPPSKTPAVSLAGAGHKYHCRSLTTSLPQLSLYKRFVATKLVFCRDKCPDKHVFVATKECFTRPRFRARSEDNYWPLI